MGGNRFTVNTHLLVGDVFSRMGLTCSDKTLAETPVISWVIKTLGHFPEEDDSFRYQNIEVTVEDVEDNKIDNVIIKLDTDSVCHTEPHAEHIRPVKKEAR